MKSYRQSEVYKVSKLLALRVRKMSFALQNFEVHKEGNRVRSSLKSATAMIVEGHGCLRYKAGFIKYFVYSQSECDETIVQPDFLFETDSLKAKALYTDLKNKYNMLSKRTNTFIQWMGDNFKP